MNPLKIALPFKNCMFLRLTITQKY